MRRTIGSESSNLVAWQIGLIPGRTAPFSRTLTETPGSAECHDYVDIAIAAGSD